ncbi:hypothetical protein pVco7_gp076 [Vibrio phage pVco-7]
MKYLFILLLLIGLPAKAELNSACADLIESMASEDVVDETGSISQAYDCARGKVTIIANINESISKDTLTQYAPTFGEQYCLSISKNYLLADPTTENWIEVVFRGGVKTVIKHPEMKPIIHEYDLDICLQYVEQIRAEMPKDGYEQVKFIHQYKLKGER